MYSLIALQEIGDGGEKKRSPFSRRLRWRYWHAFCAAAHFCLLSGLFAAAARYKPTGCDAPSWTALLTCFDRYPAFRLKVAFVNCENRTVKPDSANYLAASPVASGFDGACDGSLDSNRTAYPPAALIPYVYADSAPSFLNLGAALLIVALVTAAGHVYWAAFFADAQDDEIFGDDGEAAERLGKEILKRRWVRWAEYSVSASLMTVVVFYFSGYNVSEILAFAATLTFATMWLGSYGEDLVDSTGFDETAKLVAAASAALATQGVQWCYALLLYRWIDASEGSEKYVRPFLGSVFAGYASFPICYFVFLFRDRRDRICADDATTTSRFYRRVAVREFAFSLLSLIAKGLLYGFLSFPVVQWLNMDP